MTKLVTSYRTLESSNGTITAPHSNCTEEGHQTLMHFRQRTAGRHSSLAGLFKHLGATGEQRNPIELEHNARYHHCLATRSERKRRHHARLHISVISRPSKHSRSRRRRRHHLKRRMTKTQSSVSNVLQLYRSRGGWANFLIISFAARGRREDAGTTWKGFKGKQSKGIVFQCVH